MDPCKGFADWLECLQCSNLCTKQCPIESEDVMEEMKKKMRTLSGPGADFGERRYTDKRENR